MYSIKAKVDYSDIKEILRNLIYVKRYVRNALNHASEENHVADEYDEYFSELGYKVSSELSVSEVETFIRKAIHHIRMITC